MAYFTKSIQPRVRLHVVESDRFKTNYMTVSFLLPLRAGEPALTSLLPNVLRCGTVSYPDLASLNRQYDLLYSSNIEPFRYRRGDIECFGFGCSMLREAFIPDGTDVQGGVFALLSEMLFAPRTENGVFFPAFVENEKRVLIDNIRAQINNKVTYALNRCAEEMCAAELYSLPVLGTEEEAAAITPQALYDYYRQILHTAQIEIFFMGKCDTDRLCDSLCQLFAPISGSGVPLPDTEVKRRADGTVKEVLERQPVSQGKLSLGFRTGRTLSDEDYLTFSMFVSVFSSSPISKLFMNVREKLSLCYYCTAVPEAHKGIMVVTSGIQNENRNKARQEILRQLQDMCDGDITDEEMEAARRFLLNAYRELQDSPAGLENWYMNRMLAKREESPREAAEKLALITKEDIARVARDITLDTVYFMEGTEKEDAPHE